MKILYFYQYFTTPKGSWGTRAYEFARRWVKAGDTVTIVTSYFDKSDLHPTSLLSRFAVDGIDVRLVNVRVSNKHGYAFRLLTFSAYAFVACWYALTVPADVVLASSGPLSVGLPALVARYLRGLPLVFEVRDLWPEGAVQLGIVRNRCVIRAARWFEQLCYRAAATVVPLSEGMAGWIGDRYDVVNTVVVPNASDNELADHAGALESLPSWARGKRVAVYAGTLGLIDDCRQILEVAAILQRRRVADVEFAIIGDGKERPALEQAAQRLRLEHVHFLGLRSREEVMAWLRAARCALFTVKDVPFLATASPNKLFDAFAAGTPIVQTTQGWIKALLERERCGITVPQGDYGAMADAVLALARDDDLRAGLARSSRRVGREQFDRGILASKMRSILMAAAPEPRTAVLMYHDVTLGEDATGYTVSRSKLERDLEAVCKPDGRVPCRVTFDDGHAGTVRHGLPALQSRNLVGTLFVTADFVGRQGFVDRSMLREWCAAGQLLGSHAVTHRSLNRMDEREAAAELRDSKARLEDIVGAPVNEFAFPNGDENARLRKLAFEAGYARVHTSRPAFARENDAVLPRFVIRSATPVDAITSLRDGRLTPVLVGERIRWSVKRALGTSLYTAVASRARSPRTHTVR